MCRLTKYNLLLVSLLVGLLVTSCVMEDQAGNSAYALAVKYMEDSGVSGLAISVGTGQDIVWSEGFGFADLEQRVRVDSALTRFRVGSTAKSMTAMALGQLHEAGKLNLDEPIQTYLPTFPDKEATITTRMLAGHLGGIRHYKDDEFYSAASYTSIPDALEIFINDPVEVRPGTRYSYSTYGFNLISAVIERAAHQDFLGYMAESVFSPIGMTQTVADRVVPIISNRSRYYRLQDGQLVNTRWVDNSNKWAGGGFLSTSEDLVRFGLAHLSERFLQEDTIKMMWTTQFTSEGEETGYGIGWRIGTDERGRQVIGHTGGSVGGTTNLRIYPQQDFVIAVISNTSKADLGPFTDSIVDVFLEKVEKGPDTLLE